MARKPRIEVPGGLYHIISRGNNRRKIFRSHDDYLKFTSKVAQQKAKLPFYLYAYWRATKASKEGSGLSLLTFESPQS